MQRNSQKHNLAAAIQTITVGIIMLVGIIVILYGVTEGIRTVLYVGLCITGVGVGLGLLQLILRRSAMATRAKMHDLFEEATRRKRTPGSDPSGEGTTRVQ